MRALLTLLALLLPVLAQAQMAPDHTASKPNLTILVDDGLLLPMSQLARQYTLESHTPLTLVVKDGPMAANQIGQGLEAHVLITANQALVDGLVAQGLTDVTSRHAIATTPLALVAPPALNRQGLVARHISFAAILLATPQLPIYLLKPPAPEGEMAASLRQGYEFSDTLNSRAVELAGRSEMLAALNEKPGLALMLASDAISTPQLTILSALPASVQTPLPFDSVVLASESMQDARQFNDFLTSRAAQEILGHFGFQPPAAKTAAVRSAASAPAVQRSENH